jgi:hypothetical protein
MVPQNNAPAIDFDKSIHHSGLRPGIIAPSNVETIIPPSIAQAMTKR